MPYTTTVFSVIIHFHNIKLQTTYCGKVVVEVEGVRVYCCKLVGTGCPGGMGPVNPAPVAVAGRW